MANRISEPRSVSQRQLKVGEHIRHMLSLIIQRNNFHDPILSQSSISISQVKMSPDLRHARIYISILSSTTKVKNVKSKNVKARDVKVKDVKAINNPNDSIRQQTGIHILPSKPIPTVEVVNALNKHSYLICRQIANNLTMKFLPRLFFVEDNLIDHVTRLEEIFHSPHVMQDLKKL